MLIDSVMNYARPATVDISKVIDDSDTLTVQWAKSMSQARKDFYATADHSYRRTAPVRDQYKQAYKDFHQYLNKTIELVELLPTNAKSRLCLEYSSGISDGQLITAAFGKIV